MADQPTRHLAAIMFADMVGYTALMQTDEEAARTQRDVHRKLIASAVQRHHGEILQFYGDGTLCIFASAVEAVECAVEVQLEVNSQPVIPLRIGVHTGDIVHDADGIYGDGVNLASRIEELSAPGGVMISGKVYDEIKNRPSISTVSIGAVRLKNVQQPVPVFAVSNQGLQVPDGHPAFARAERRPPGGAVQRVTADAAGRPGGWRWVAWSSGPVLLGLAIGLWLWSRTPPSGPVSATPAGPVVVAVFPCEVTTQSVDASTLADVEFLLEKGLQGVGSLRIVPTQELSKFGSVAPSAARPIANTFGAGSFILCRVREYGDSLRIFSDVYSTGIGRDTSFTVQGGAGDDPLNVVNELAMDLAMWFSDETIDSDRMRRLLPASIAAFHQFMNGENLFNAGRYEQASEAFDRAIHEDKANALAWYRLSMAREFSMDFLGADRAIDTASLHSENLTEPDRELMTAWKDFIGGRYDDAERRYNGILSRRPNDRDAESGLAEVLAHYNPVRGKSTLEAKEHLKRVLAVRPGYGEGRFHLLELAAMEGDSAAFRGLQTGVDASSFHALGWEAVRAFGWGSAREQDEVLARLKDADPITVMFAVGRVGAHLHDFEGAERLTEALLTSLRTPDWKAVARVMRAESRVARGQFERAREELALAAQTERDWSLELGALIELFPFADSSSGRLVALRNSIEAWNPLERDANLAMFFQPHAESHKTLRFYLLGLLSARLGDIAAAGQMEREVRAGTLPNREFHQELAGSIRARVLLARGDTAGAMGALLPVQQPLERIIGSPFFSSPHDRMLMAELLEKRGQLLEADSIYMSLTEGFDAMFAAPAHLSRARVLEALQEDSAAAWHYARFAELWRDADPELQPRVAEARERARQLARPAAAPTTGMSGSSAEGPRTPHLPQGTTLLRPTLATRPIRHLRSDSPPTLRPPGTPAILATSRPSSAQTAGVHSSSSHQSAIRARQPPATGCSHG